MITKEMIKRWMLEDGSGILYDSHNDGIFSGYVTITPERGKMLLEINTHNRPLKMHNVDAISEAICRGKWDDNTAKINITDSMTISDGQNRLTACVNSGVSIRTIVTVGVSDSTQGVTDRRGSRSLKDDLAIAGVKESTNVAAVTRMLMLSKEYGSSVKELGTQRGSKRARISDVTYWDYYWAHKEEIHRINSLAARAYEKTRYLKIPKELVTVLAYKFDSINSDDAREFWRRLGDNVFENSDDPIRLLHMRLFSSASNPHTKLSKETVAALIIKAWNSFERGETMKQLKYMPGGAKPEVFPEIFNPYEQ